MFDSIELEKPKWGGDDFESKLKAHEEHLDKMVYLYNDELLSFEEIGKRLNIDWWIVKQLFNKHQIPRITMTERAKLKRKKVFPIIYKLHYEHNLSFVEIYKKHGYSPAYCKLVLSEGICKDSP